MSERVDITERDAAPEPDEGAGEPGVPGPDGTRWALRMKDLCDAAGLQRQAIHFYIKEGILPAGLKSSRNMAWYGQVHLDRLALVRRLQHERFLPLKAITAVLDGEHATFGESQQAFIRDVKRHVDRTLKGPERIEARPVEALLARTGVSEADLAELDKLGLAPMVVRDGQRVVAADDEWVVEILGELRRLGFTEEAGFAVSDLAIYEEAISRLFERETAMIAERLTHFTPDRAAHMVERMLPLAHRFLERYHETKIRRFFAAWE